MSHDQSEQHGAQPGGSVRADPRSAAKHSPADAAALLHAATARRRELLLKLGVTLHSAGTPSHQLEELLTRLAARLGLNAAFFAVPTAIFAQFNIPDDASGGTSPLDLGRVEDISLRRVEPGGIDLGRLAQAHALYDAVYAGELSLGEAIHELDVSAKSPPPSRGSIWLAYPVVAGSTAVLLGGSLADLITSIMIGAVVGLIAEVGTRAYQTRRLIEPLSAAFAAMLSLLAAALGWTSTPELALLAGVTILLPGMTLTQALAELAHRNLASGSARLTGAGLTFLTLGFGAALGRALGERFVTWSTTSESSPLPSWAPYLALVLSAVALAHLFRAPKRELPFIVVASGIAFFGASLGSYALSPELGVGLASFALALFSNGYARITHRPAAIALIPGLIVLVPGSLGFRSLNLLMGHAAIDGIDAAVTMAVVATALVTGLLVANAILPERAVLAREQPLRYTNSGFHLRLTSSSDSGTATTET